MPALRLLGHDGAETARGEALPAVLDVLGEDVERREHAPVSPQEHRDRIQSRVVERARRALAQPRPRLLVQRQHLVTQGRGELVLGEAEDLRLARHRR